jgi:hypothetical protein
MARSLELNERPDEIGEHVETSAGVLHDDVASIKSAVHAVQVTEEDVRDAFSWSQHKFLLPLTVRNRVNVSAERPIALS